MFSARSGFFYITAPISYMLSSDASLYTSSVVKPDGSLWIWGRSNFGNLGLNDNTFRSVPTQLDSSSWTQVSNFNTHTYAIKSNGTLWAWGYGANGQLGNNTTINRSSPVQMGASTNWLYLPTLSDITSNSGAAINTSGQLYTWGFGSAGLLGNNSTISRSNPVQVAGSWSSIGVTNQNAAGITTDGNLWGWGDNSYKQLDNTTANRSSPVQLAAGLVYTKVAIGDRAFAAIANDSTAWVWGYNLTGQLGLNDLVSRSSPVQLNGSWTQISISSNRSYGIKSDGTLWGWGINDGTIGINAELSWSQVSSGSHVVAIRSDGSLWTWGSGQYGQLGSGTTISRSIPIQISSSSWTQVSVNAQCSYAIKIDGSLWGWGRNSLGEIGDGSVIPRSDPVQIGSDSWTSISASKNGFSAMGIRDDNTLYVWGYNNAGRLGIGDTIHRSFPVQIPGSWSNVSAGTDHGLAINASGTLWAWGSSLLGQLGNNSTIARSSPVQIGALTNWSKVSAGSQFSLALNTSAILYSWGENATGQLGQGDVVNRSIPTKVGTSSWSQISAGSNFALGVTIDNNILAWGDGAFGQLNQFSNVGGRSTPTQLGQLSTMNNTNNVSVYAGFTTSFQINRIGMLWGWGASSNGQLTNTNSSNTQAIAVVTTASFSSPIQIGTSSWVSINAITVTANSGTGGMGVTTDNVLYAWGWASTGSTYLARNGNGSLVGIEPEPESLTF